MLQYLQPPPAPHCAVLQQYSPRALRAWRRSAPSLFLPTQPNHRIEISFPGPPFPAFQQREGETLYRALAPPISSSRRASVIARYVYLDRRFGENIRQAVGYSIYDESHVDEIAAARERSGRVRKGTDWCGISSFVSFCVAGWVVWRIGCCVCAGLDGLVVVWLASRFWRSRVLQAPCSYERRKVGAGLAAALGSAGG